MRITHPMRLLQARRARDGKKVTLSIQSTYYPDTGAVKSLYEWGQYIKSQTDNWYGVNNQQQKGE